MRRGTNGALALAVTALAAGSARAGEADEVLERAAVRNRIFSVAGRAELGPSLGVSILDRLTNHYTLSAAGVLNLTETFAVEARGGYALSRHTGYARGIGVKLLQRDPLGPSGGLQIVDDLTDLWEMRFNLMAGVRWAPVYGKLSLMAELPVHFQAYVWLGGGLGGLHRESVAYCLAVTSREEGTCGEWLVEDRTAPIGGVALGVRFFASQTASIKLELRDYAFVDTYRVQIDRAAAERGDASSGVAGPGGLTHLVLFDVGYSFVF